MTERIRWLVVSREQNHKINKVSSLQCALIRNKPNHYYKQKTTWLEYRIKWAFVFSDQVNSPIWILLIVKRVLSMTSVFFINSSLRTSDRRSTIQGLTVIILVFLLHLSLEDTQSRSTQTLTHNHKWRNNVVHIKWQYTLCISLGFGQQSFSQAQSNMGN